MQVWTVSSAGKVTDRLSLHLPLPDAIIKAAEAIGTPLQTPAAGANPYMDLALGIAWLPGSDTVLVVTMPLAVLVYDLARSARHPLAAVGLPGSDQIASSAVGLHMISRGDDQVGQVFASAMACQLLRIASLVFFFAERPVSLCNLDIKGRSSWFSVPNL